MLKYYLNSISITLVLITNIFPAATITTRLTSEPYSQTELDEKFIISADKNDIIEFKKLLSLGANVNAVMIDDFERPRSALINSIYSGNLEMVNLLIENNVDINLPKDATNANALMVACNENNIDIVKVLLKNKADLNVINNNGFNVLIRTIALCPKENLDEKIEIIKLLLNENIDIDFADEDGNTALDYAISSENQNLISLLQEEPKRRLEAKEKREKTQALLNAIFPASLMQLTISYLPDVLKEQN